MNPGNYNIVVQRGSTFSLGLTAEDDLGNINFTSTYTDAELLVWPAWALEKGISGEPLLSLTKSNVGIVMEGETLTLQLDKDSTKAINFTEGVYELKLINTIVLPNIVDPFLKGKFIIEGLG